ncbi:MAG: ECF transporter S component [Clostridiales bacterium]
MQRELNEKSKYQYQIKDGVKTALVVALVCMIMPFVTVNANGVEETFSIYGMFAYFYKSAVGLHFTFEAKGLLMVLKVIALSIMASVVFGLLMLFNKNKATKNSDNSIFTIFSSLVGIAMVFGYFYYLRYIIGVEVDSHARVILKVGAITLVVALVVVVLLLLMLRIKKRLLMVALLTCVVIPGTIAFGMLFLEDRRYYVISLLIIFETMIPFFMVFENRKPQARELILIAVIAAIAVAGRAAFFMVPQFKPVVAIVIIAGVCLGAETGFLVGALTALVSNFFVGQGPFTPWQMFSLGIIGFLAGVLFEKGWLSKKRLPLCVFGFFSALVIYGFLMDTCTILTSAFKSQQAFYFTYLSGLPFNFILGVATSFFLFILANPMIEKIERIKIKYGLILTSEQNPPAD